MKQQKILMQGPAGSEVPYRPDVEALNQMKNSRYNHPSTKWAAYQNHDLGHRDCGHLKFLAVGPENTCPEAPNRMPDGPTEVNWRYVLVGYVDLRTGDIVLSNQR